MPETKKLTFENLAQLMYRRGLLSKEQLADVIARVKSQESRLFSRHHTGSLREIAIKKMLEGVTTYEEVVSMTG